MDTCILIPEEFGLVLTLHPNPLNVMEMDVAIWSNVHIPAGYVFHPNQGKLRLEKLEIYSKLQKDDIRNKFGCHDEIFEVEERDVRHCNWIRFIKSSTDINDVNIVATLVKGQAVFQVIKHIKPNDEIVVFFNDEATYAKADPETVTSDLKSVSETDTDTLNETPEEEINVVDIEDDDSKFEESPVLNSSTESESMEKKILFTPPSIIKSFMTSPIVRDDDCRSNISDVMSTSDDQASTKLECTESDLTNSSPEEIIREKPVRRNRERTWLPCEVCGKKFDRPSLLKRHMRTHTGEKPHACDVCGKAFSTSSSLNTHRRIHSGEKPHVCKVCGKRFTASSNLYYHKMTHDKEKPHKCTLCSKSFPTPGDLRSHMYVHNGSWPFKCNVCHRGFSKQTNLKNHMLLHSGDKPHECGLCGKKFALQCNLKTHLKTHECSDTQGECQKCGKTFSIPSGSGSPKRCPQCQRIRPEDSENSHTRRSPSDFSISRLTESTPKTFKESSPRKIKDEFGSKSNFSSPEYLKSPPFSSPKDMTSPTLMHNLLSPLQPTNYMNSVHQFSPSIFSTYMPNTRLFHLSSPSSVSVIQQESAHELYHKRGRIYGGDLAHHRSQWPGLSTHGYS